MLKHLNREHPVEALVGLELGHISRVRSHVGQPRLIMLVAR